MKFGAHISTSKPFSDSIVRAQDLGCDCMQIFANPPQRWNPIAISEDEIKRFQKSNEKAKINPIIIHSIYLVNLASDNPFFYEASIRTLIDDMKKAELLGAVGTNVHIGSTKGRTFEEVMTKVTLAIKDVLAATPDKTSFIIENSAGAGSIIGDTIEEIAKIIQSMNSPRVKVLIDTAHAFASGYDIRTAEGIEKFVGKFEKEIGLDKLVGFHLNDSKTGLDSKRDRHADLGHGEIGLSTFKYLVNHPKLKDLCGILETPQDTITWAEQLKTLRAMEAK